MGVGDVDWNGFSLEESLVGFSSLTTREECCEVFLAL